jgi:hypothetical protein
MRRLVAAAAVVLLAGAVLTACGESSTGSYRIRAARDDVVVARVVTQGGFGAETLARTEVPRVSVFGDGRVVVVGPSILVFPGPALPNLQEFRISRAGLRGVLAEARQAGLLADPPPDYGNPGVTDQPTTTVTVHAGGITRDVQVYALDFEAAAPLEAKQIKNRLLLLRFIEMIGDPDALHDFVEPGSERRYTPTALAVIIRPAEPTGDEPRAWPLDDLATAGTAYGRLPDARCKVYDHGQLAAVLDAARPASAGDLWASAGATYTLEFRPLLPDQRGCDDLE